MNDVLEGAINRIVAEKNGQPEPLSDEAIFTVQWITTHKDGTRIMRMQCVWIEYRGRERREHIEECDIPGVGIFAACMPGDRFKLIPLEDSD